MFREHGDQIYTGMFALSSGTRTRILYLIELTADLTAD
jgi:hypothetical protein